MRWLDSITDSMHMDLSELQETVRTQESDVMQSMRLPRVRHGLVTAQQQQNLPPHCGIICVTFLLTYLCFLNI